MKCAISCTLFWICTLSVVAESEESGVLGLPQAFHLGSAAYPMPSPSATKVAIRVSDQEHQKRFLRVFFLDSDTGHWKDLPLLDVTGAGPRTQRWGLDQQGEEFFAIPEWERAIAIREDELELLEMPKLTFLAGPAEAASSRLRSWRHRWESPEQGRAYLQALRDSISVDMPPESQAHLREMMDVDLHAVKDVAPDGRTVLIHELYAPGNAVTGLDLQDGTVTSYTVNAPCLVKSVAASFSPDGNFVLISFSCEAERSPLPIPGYLQLFTRDGRFVEELSAYDANGFWITGDFEWLHNDWIVYTTPSHIVFRKYLGSSSEKPNAEE